VTDARASKLLASFALRLSSRLIIAVLLGLPALASAQDKVNPTAVQVKAFLDRVNAYVEARKDLEKGLTPVSPSDSTTAVEQHTAALAGRVRATRRGARQGDLFGDAAPLFKEILARDRRNRGAQDTGAVLEEVPSGSRPVINGVYPERAVLATVPPLVLANLRPPSGARESAATARQHRVPLFGTQSHFARPGVQPRRRLHTRSYSYFEVSACSVAHGVSRRSLP
jgi:hypothetical protein